MLANIPKPEQTEERLQLTQFMLEQAGDAVFCVESDARFSYVNRAACTSLGYSREELLTMSVFDISPDLTVSAWPQHWQEIRQRQSFTIESTHQTKCGRIIPVEITVNYFKFNDKEYNCTIARDISLRKQAEIALNAQACQQAAVAELGQQALENQDLPTLFNQATHLVSNILDVEYAMVLEGLSDNQAFFLRAGVGWQAGLVGTTTVSASTKSQAGYTLKIANPVIVTDLRVETRFSGSPLLHNHQVISGLSVIIPMPGQPFGVLSVHTSEQRSFSQDDVYFLQSIANCLAAAISRQQAQEKLHLMERAIAFSPNGVVITDATAENNPIIYANPSFERMTGYTAEEIMGQNCRFLQADDRDQSSLEELRTAMAQGQSCSVVLRNYRQDGSLFWNHLSIAPVLNHQGHLTHFIGTQNDITDRKQAEEQIQHDALHDTLTGLPNRALFMDRLNHVMQLTRRRQTNQFAVLFVDLDNFKVINDSLGHKVGDQLLITMAQKLMMHLRPSDTIARLGGDEFIILLEDIQDPAVVSQVAERIQTELRSPMNLDGREVCVTASIGIAMSDLGYEQAADLLRDADTAMYQAKASGRSCYQVFDQTMHARSLRRLELETALRLAIEQYTLQVYYQPIVSLTTSEVVGFEALVRWQHAELGFISPNEFIPIAEETGLIHSLGQWVLEQACRQLHQWRQKYGRPLRVSVNLSSQQLPNPEFIQQIDQILQQTGLDGRALTLEITESVLIKNTTAATQILRDLQARSIHVCIDDFGTGYSSLSYLHRFPVNTLKIDRSLIKGMSTDAENYEIVRAIIGLTHNLDIDVIAEGLETQQQFDDLKALGCDLGQGFFFAKPLPAAASTDLFCFSDGPSRLG